jgi:molybdopterin-guanine dinucleotide biosynthesis protein A
MDLDPLANDSVAKPITTGTGVPSTGAIVLAGGKSSRMGTPKALLPFDGTPLIVHIVSMLRQLFDEVVIVAAPGQELPPMPMPVTLVHDDVAYQGPVGGIYYGLSALRPEAEAGFVTSCDSAFLNLALIAHLVEKIATCDVVVPHWEGRFQPLHAVYRKSVAPLLAAQLARGELRPVQLFERVRTCRAEEEEIRRLDPEGESFFNMNTPADYDEALRRWRNRSSDSRGTSGSGTSGGSTSSGSTSSGSTSSGSTSGGSTSSADFGLGRGTQTQAERLECVVELYGVARMLARAREVPVMLPREATLAQALAALADALPVLVGQVITPDRAQLVEGYACNVNGLEFVRTPTASIKPGDRIVILSADAGG